MAFGFIARPLGGILFGHFGYRVGGAFAPTILLTEYAISWVSVYIAIALVLSLLSVIMLTETYKNSLTD